VSPRCSTASGAAARRSSTARHAAGDGVPGLQLTIGRHQLNLHWAHHADGAAAAAVGAGSSARASPTGCARGCRPSIRARSALPPWAETLCSSSRPRRRCPEWADPEKLDRGSRLAVLYGILDSLILCCGSLPWCYLDAKGVPVLASTQRLQGARVYRRIWETSHFVVNAVAPGGLGPNGKGSTSRSACGCCTPPSAIACSAGGRRRGGPSRPGARPLDARQRRRGRLGHSSVSR
jgi:hypothetical protein